MESMRSASHIIYLNLSVQLQIFKNEINIYSNKITELEFTFLVASFGSAIQVAPFRQAGVHTNGKALTRFLFLVCAKLFN